MVIWTSREHDFRNSPLSEVNLPWTGSVLMCSYTERSASWHVELWNELFPYVARTVHVEMIDKAMYMFQLNWGLNPFLLPLVTSLLQNIKHDLPIFWRSLLGAPEALVTYIIYYPQNWGRTVTTNQIISYDGKYKPTWADFKSMTPVYTQHTVA